MIDATGHLWFEEYPMEAPTKVLNGFIFTIFGIYDYYQVTHQTEAKDLLQGGLTTVKDYVAPYRLPENYSRYCLKHLH